MQYFLILDMLEVWESIFYKQTPESRNKIALSSQCKSLFHASPAKRKNTTQEKFTFWNLNLGQTFLPLSAE
ncbi:hypothetical protein CbuD7D7780_09320 [Coxiella burnetii]|nr:hypothetical protein CbuD7E6568_09305 [Coxiella burnetii]OYK81755.1 hypothetical protein CbuD7D7780_09320 [Coxiella burnetii]